MALIQTVLISGGLDSTVNLTVAKKSGEVAMGITFDYGQRAAEREIVAARRICERYDVRHKTVALPWLGDASGSALVAGGRPVPTITREAIERNESTASDVWVPNRNGVFINVAAAYAESLNSDVVVGFNAEEAAAFPDNSTQFIEAANAALRISTRNAVKVVSYTAEMDKVQIFRLGLEHGAPLDLIWPCYLGGENICGSCESCVRFIRAALKSGGEEWLDRWKKG